MWCSKILVAYDGSAPSFRALDLAQNIAAGDKSIELVFTHAVKMISTGAAAVGAETVFVEEAASVREELQQLADALDNPATVKLLKGTSAADLIIHAAHDEGCDLIVMGSRGKGGVRGYLGSVSYAVVQRAGMPVLIAPDEQNGDR